MRYLMRDEYGVFDGFLTWIYDGFEVSPIPVKVSKKVDNPCCKCGEATPNYFLKGPRKGGTIFVCSSCMADESMQVEKEYEYCYNKIVGNF